MNMIIQENDNLQEEGRDMFNWNELEPSPSNCIFPDDIPIIESYCEEDLHFSDGMFHIDDL